MNLMVRALRSNPTALSEFEGQSEVPYWQLKELAAVDEGMERLIRAADADPLLSRELSTAFAAVVGLDEWDEPTSSEEVTAVDESVHNEWVTIIPVPMRSFGLTLPDDRLDEPRISLFGREGETVRRVSVVVLPGNPPTLELRVAGGECSFPYRGRCEGGSCQQCQQHWIEHPGQPAGFACVCQDDPLSSASMGEETPVALALDLVESSDAVAQRDYEPA